MEISSTDADLAASTLYVVTHYQLRCVQFHDETVAALRFESPTGIQASELYSLPEIANVLANWRNGWLKGSFGVGTILAENATFDLVSG